MRLRTVPVGAWTVLDASGELDLAAVPELRRTLGGLLDGTGATVVVDLSGVSLLDCSCIGVFSSARQLAEERQASLRFVGARGRVLKVLEITDAVRELGMFVPDPAAGRAQRDAALEEVESLLLARAAQPDDARRRQVLRDLAVERCMPVAQWVAGQFRYTRQSNDDLRQVAVLGLLKALDRYDPGRGAKFLSFAFPTILGELRRHFRDHTWGVHVPRHLQELGQSVKRAADALAQQLRRIPTTAELAEHLHADDADVREALRAARGYAPSSLAQPVGDSDVLELGDRLGGHDEDLERVDDHESLQRLLAELPDQERQVLAYRFFGNLTQTQLAGILGVSQMQVSRVQTRALRRLREGLLAEG